MTTRWPWLLLAGCAPGPVAMSGRIAASLDDATALSGAEVLVLDESLEEVVSAATGPDGRFAFEVPGGTGLHAVISAADHVPVAFWFESGLAETFEVPEGTLFGVTGAEVDAERARFAGCPGADDADGVVFGIVRVALAVSDVDRAPVEPNSFVYASDAGRPDGARTEACYLAPDGTAYRDNATSVGPTGRFAIFGEQGGGRWLTVARLIDGGTLVSRRPLFVPDGGVVSRQPALAPF